MFNASILFNITLGNPYEEMILNKIIKITELDATLLEKGESLNYVISEAGANLSGGQKQRILLCRYLYFAQQTHYGILMLDEPTSALDIESEYRILNNIFENFPEVTIIMVSHNRKLEMEFNKIIEIK